MYTYIKYIVRSSFSSIHNTSSLLMVSTDAILTSNFNMAIERAWLHHDFQSTPKHLIDAGTR